MFQLLIERAEEKDKRLGFKKWFKGFKITLLGLDIRINWNTF